ncbi:hypothetical protein LH23_04480 [Cedecea neteri]|uniref:Endonuclease/exonuclease/phosphatase domain-containing protein n=2 Tax=Cedecea neteri TaxID=158822 RepID=A0AAN0VSR5_9ENTR|nr:hypothetical protein LH23_04480 [Cedecea neteri]
MEKTAIDILILAEVSHSCLSFLEKLAETVHMELITSTEKVGRINFDIAILYEKTKLQFLEKENLVPETASGRKLRCGTRFLFQENISHEKLTLFASHWPSRLHKSEKRITLGQKLRENIDFIYNKKIDNVILIGDYNDQPFSPSIVEGLEATKDIDMVKRKRKLLYNPFWRHLDKKNESHLFSGSYYHKNNDIDKWFTYDQMMFSSSFLNDKIGTWRLDIKSSHFHSDSISKNEIGFDFLSFFDHVPIYSKIHKI